MGKGWKSIALKYSMESQGEALELSAQKVSLWEKEPLSFHQPAIDVYENPLAIWLELELPGVRPEHIQIHITSGTLLIQGKKEDPDAVYNRRYHMAERVFGPFRRTLILPKTAIGKEAKAMLEGGILKVIIPKCQSSKKVVISHEP